MEISKIIPFFRWHPEVAMRYLPIVTNLKKEGTGSVLEVGSGSLGITPYLGWKVTGLDENFSGPKHSLISYVNSTGQKIPFSNSSFDYVISVDTFEHVPKQFRPMIISEMLRVAKKMIIIAAPMGELSQQQDLKLAQNYLKKFGSEFPFLSEHEKNRLPNIEDIENAIQDEASLKKKSIKIRIEGNENLKLREFLMNGWMTKNIFVNFFFRKVLLLAIPIFKFFEKEPYYRRIFFVTILK